MTFKRIVTQCRPQFVFRREGLEIGPVSITVSVLRITYFSQSIVWLDPFRTQFLFLHGPTGERKVLPDLGRSNQEIYEVN